MENIQFHIQAQDPGENYQIKKIGRQSQAAQDPDTQA